MTVITCGTCKNEYSDKLEACHHCGEPRPKNIFGQPISAIQSIQPDVSNSQQPQNSPHQIKTHKPSPLKRILVIALLIVVTGILAAIGRGAYLNHMNGSDTSNVLNADASTLQANSSDEMAPESAYDDPAIPNLSDEHEYKKAVFGEYAVGQQVVFAGTVTQIRPDNTFILATPPQEPNSSLGRYVLVHTNDQAKILVGDTVGVKGRFESVEELEALDGSASNKYPKFIMDYYNTDDVFGFFKARRIAIQASKNAALKVHQDALQKELDDQQLSRDVDAYNQMIVRNKAEIQRFTNVDFRNDSLSKLNASIALAETNCANKSDPEQVIHCKTDAVSQTIQDISDAQQSQQVIQQQKVVMAAFQHEHESQ
jgi:hypothetical protein